MNPLDHTRRNCSRLFHGISTLGAASVCERKLAIILVMIIALWLSPVQHAQTNPPGEYEIKAAFLFNFAKFIDWPNGTFASSQSPITICVLGKDPFGHALDDNLRGKMIGDQPLAIRRVKDTAEARRCQMVFVSSSETGHFVEILESLRGANLLLVGDTAGFASSGGTIEFTLDRDNHVRFTINTDAADRSGLKFSAKLLALAKIVHDDGHAKGE